MCVLDRICFNATKTIPIRSSTNEQEPQPSTSQPANQTYILLLGDIKVFIRLMWAMLNCDKSFVGYRFACDVLHFCFDVDIF